MILVDLTPIWKVMRRLVSVSQATLIKTFFFVTVISMGVEFGKQMNSSFCILDFKSLSSSRKKKRSQKTIQGKMFMR